MGVLREPIPRAPRAASTDSGRSEHTRRRGACPSTTRDRPGIIARCSGALGPRRPPPQNTRIVRGPYGACSMARISPSDQAPGAQRPPGRPASGAARSRASRWRANAPAARSRPSGSRSRSTPSRERSFATMIHRGVRFLRSARRAKTVHAERNPHRARRRGCRRTSKRGRLPAPPGARALRRAPARRPGPRPSCPGSSVACPTSTARFRVRRLAPSSTQVVPRSEYASDEGNEDSIRLRRLRHRTGPPLTFARDLPSDRRGDQEGR